MGAPNPYYPCRIFTANLVIPFINPHSLGVGHHANSVYILSPDIFRSAYIFYEELTLPIRSTRTLSNWASFRNCVPQHARAPPLLIGKNESMLYWRYGSKSKQIFKTIQSNPLSMRSVFSLT